MGLPRSLLDLIADQWGAIAIRQGPDHGVSSRTLRGAAAREGWEDPFPGLGVRLHPASSDTFERRVSAAVLAAGNRALASRWTAAHLHRLTSHAPGRLEIVVPYGRGVPDLGPKVHVWRSRTLLDRDVARPRGIESTAIDRTCCDIPAVTTPRRLRNLLIDGRQRRLLSLDRVLRRSKLMAGTTGLPMLRMVCWQLDASRCDSVLAEWIRDELVGVGLSPDPGEIPVTADNGVTVHIDVGFQRYRIGIEAEGLAAHAERPQLERDARRRNTLRLTDWRIIWVTWERMETDADGVVTEVTDELRRRGWPG